MQFYPVATYPLVIRQGKTERWRFQVSNSGETVFKPVLAATAAAPCVITVVGHALPQDWPFRIVSAKGMTGLNLKTYFLARAQDANTLSLHTLNTLGEPAYIPSSGAIQYEQPMDLTGCTARGSLRESVGGAELLLLTPHLTVDVANAKVDLALPAVVTASLAGISGVYDIELVTGAGEVIELIPPSPVVIRAEVTT